MPRLWKAAIAIAVAAGFVAPAAAQASVSSSTITSWVSSEPNTPANDPYLIYTDNPPASTLTVKGQASATSPSDTVDIDCFYGSAPTIVKLGTVTVSGGAFTASNLNFQRLAGHACRLSAVPHNATTLGAAFTGPQLAVSEAESVVIASGLNVGKAYDFYLDSTTLTGTAAWAAAGTPSPTGINPRACGGPNISPIDSSFNVGSPAIDCAGALMSDDLGSWGGRSEVQVDGRNAYDAASAQALFAAKSSPATPASQALSGFPSLMTSVQWDPTSGLISSTSKESWVACAGPNAEVPTFATCPSFTSTGVQLQRTITTAAGGRVVSLTDTWSSTDGAPHSLDLLYDDTVGLSNSTPRGYEFPAQSAFSTHLAGDSVPGVSAAPGSILVHTNLSAADGDPAEAFGAISFSGPPSGFHFLPAASATPPPSFEMTEHQAVQVPAGGSTTLKYVYSVGYTLADASSLALAGQDQLEPLALALTAPANGTTTSTPSATLVGTAVAGSGIESLLVGGQSVPVQPDGSWTANVPLNPGSNTITAVVTDAAGATTQAQVTVVYQPPAPPPPPPPPVVKCNVPRIKGMKLPAAEKALRRAHCKVGKVKHMSSRKVRRGRVMTSSPRAGRHLAAGTKIELFVSKGPLAPASDGPAAPASDSPLTQPAAG